MRRALRQRRRAVAKLVERRPRDPASARPAARSPQTRRPPARTASPTPGSQRRRRRRATPRAERCVGSAPSAAETRAAGGRGRRPTRRRRARCPRRRSSRAARRGRRPAPRSPSARRRWRRRARARALDASWRAYTSAASPPPPTRVTSMRPRTIAASSPAPIRAASSSRLSSAERERRAGSSGDGSISGAIKCTGKSEYATEWRMMIPGVSYIACAHEPRHGIEMAASVVPGMCDSVSRKPRHRLVAHLAQREREARGARRRRAAAAVAIRGRRRRAPLLRQRGREGVARRGLLLGLAPRVREARDVGGEQVDQRRLADRRAAADEDVAAGGGVAHGGGEVGDAGARDRADRVGVDASAARALRRRCRMYIRSCASNRGIRSTLLTARTTGLPRSTSRSVAAMRASRQSRWRRRS